MSTPRGAWRGVAAALASIAVAAWSTAEAATYAGRSTTVRRAPKASDYVMCSDMSRQQGEYIGGPSGPEADLGPMSQEHYGGGYVEQDMGQCLDSCNTCPTGDCCDTVGCGDCCKPCKPAWAHRTGMWGDALYLHAASVDMAHAQQQNGLGGAGTVPYGQIGIADPGYDPGFRVGGSIALSNCTSLVMAYTFLESDAISRVEPPVIPGGGGAVGSLVIHPGAAITASIGAVDATYDIDMQMAEIEYRALMWGDSRGWINYSLGGKYARLEQNFFQTGTVPPGGGGFGGIIETSSGIDFDGGGATFGIDGERLIGRRGFSIYGNAGISPVVGQFGTVYTMINETTGTLLANAVWHDDRFVPILDYELGVAWTSRRGHVRVAAGYLAQFWFNTVSTPGYIDAVQANNYTDVNDTLTFDGLVGRIELRF